MNAPQTVPGKGLFSSIVTIINNNFRNLYQHLLLYYNEYVKQVKFAGYYTSLAELKVAVTEATNGSFAYVPNPNDATEWFICRWKNGAWVQTTETIAAGAVTINQDVADVAGGSGLLTADLRVTTTVGHLTPALASSTYKNTEAKIPSGTPIEDVIRLMFDSYQEPTLRVSGGATVECETNMRNVPISISGSMGDAVGISSIEIVRTGPGGSTKTLTYTTEEDVNKVLTMSGSAFTIAYTQDEEKMTVSSGSLYSTYTYTAKVSFKRASNQTAVINKEASTTVTVCHRYYIGTEVIQKTSITKSEIISYLKSKQMLASSDSVKATLTSASNYYGIVLLVPKHSSSLVFSDVWDGNNSGEMEKLNQSHGEITLSAGDLYKEHAQTYVWYLFWSDGGNGFCRGVGDEGFRFTVKL